MTLSIKNGGYALLIRLDLMFLCHYERSSLSKLLNELSIRNLIKLLVLLLLVSMVL